MKANRNIDEIILALRGANCRITESRRRIIELLCQSRMPLSAPELLALLRQKRRQVNKTTVYRELEFLRRHKILRQIDLLEGKKRYELLQPDSHHHHVVCVRCQSIECIEMENELEHIEQKLLTKHKFHVTSHSLEFFGVCHRCSEKGNSAPRG